jgi:broad specificity phosphatase PhoE
VILYLVRHGETDSNRRGLALGRADVPLNERGRWQARRLAEALAEARFSAVYSSPLGRALETARVIAAAQSLEVQSEDRLIEMDIGGADQLTFTEVRERFPGLLDAWAGDGGPNHPMPAGESLVQVQRRALEAVESLAELHRGETVCAVTHNFVILTLLTWVIGAEIAAFRRLRHGVGAVTIVEFNQGSARVRRLNDLCHLLQS